MRVLDKNILYTDYTGQFPIRSRRGNKYVMVAYHSSNVILVDPFPLRKCKNRLVAYDAIMQQLKENNLLVDLQILENECSKEYQATIRDRWGVKFQRVPPDMHRRNAAEKFVRKLKARFLAILTGIAHDFPHHLWDILLPHTKMTLNLMQQATANPSISAWKIFNGKFNYNTTPLGPLGIIVIFHTKTGRRQSWDFHGKYGWSVGASMTHY